MAELWHISYGDQEYDLNAEDLTVARLRQMKAWFGKEYGAYLLFINLLLQGDADAVACALWIVKKKAGEEVKEPRYLDFSVSDFFVSQEKGDENDESDPTSAEEATPTPDSAATA